MDVRVDARGVSTLRRSGLFASRPKAQVDPRNREDDQTTHNKTPVDLQQRPLGSKQRTQCQVTMTLGRGIETGQNSVGLIYRCLGPL